MAKFTATHTAYVTARGLARPGVRQFRETPKFWISENGLKFRKADGTEVGTDWATFTMRLETLKPIRAAA